MNLVTGGFSFSGRFIVDELLKIGESVRTMTNHPEKKNKNYSQIETVPYYFNDFDSLVENFKGITTFFNTYWIRFPYKETTWADAVKFCNTLFLACKKAGVKKIVHYSVTNPSLDSPYMYFRGKAVVEELLKRSGIQYTILRPAWIFEDKDILNNNIAWLLRRFPIFGLFYDGKFKMQPVSQIDLARVAVEYRHGNQKYSLNEIIDVVGPETYTYEQYIKLINKVLNSKTLIIPFPGRSTYIPILMAKFLNFWLKDRLLTIDEINSLRDNLCLTESRPLGRVSLKDWLYQNKDNLGRKWENEVKKHYY